MEVEFIIEEILEKSSTDRDSLRLLVDFTGLSQEREGIVRGLLPFIIDNEFMDGLGLLDFHLRLACFRLA